MKCIIGFSRVFDELYENLHENMRACLDMSAFILRLPALAPHDFHLFVSRSKNDDSNATCCSYAHGASSTPLGGKTRQQYRTLTR